MDERSTWCKFTTQEGKKDIRSEERISLLKEMKKKKGKENERRPWQKRGSA